MEGKHNPFDLQHAHAYEFDRKGIFAFLWRGLQVGFSSANHLGNPHSFSTSILFATHHRHFSWKRLCLALLLWSGSTGMIEYSLVFWKLDWDVRTIHANKNSQFPPNLRPLPVLRCGLRMLSSISFSASRFEQFACNRWWCLPHLHFWMHFWNCRSNHRGKTTSQERKRCVMTQSSANWIPLCAQQS